VKAKPDAGVAVRMTAVPIVYVPSPVTVPLLEGLALVVRVNFGEGVGSQPMESITNASTSKSVSISAILFI